jgi:transposase
MNCLDRERQISVVSALVEGNSIRSTVKMTGVARNTITGLLLDLAMEVGLSDHIWSTEQLVGLLG